MPFDPHHKWLGIPPSEQPPDHYRLLGISRFESDPEVIDAAANRQMAYLHGFANGEHAAASQQLLNELAAARLCLLDSKKRAAYDAVLRSRRTRGVEEDLDKAIQPLGGNRSGRYDPPLRIEPPTYRDEASVTKGSPPYHPVRPPGDQNPPEEPSATGLRPPSVDAVQAPEPRPRRPVKGSVGRFRRLPIPWRVVTAVGLAAISLALVMMRPRPERRATPPVAVEEVTVGGIDPSRPEASQPNPDAMERQHPLVAGIDRSRTQASEPNADRSRPVPAQEAGRGTLPSSPSPGAGMSGGSPTRQATAPEAEWDPPRLADFPESGFKPLFRVGTIDGQQFDGISCHVREEFTDFVLRFDYRLDSHKRQPWNGVRLRHWYDSRVLSLVLDEGLSGALLLDQALPSTRKSLVQESLDKNHYIIRPVRNAEKPFGDWNACQVVCRGPETIVSINDSIVNHIDNGAKDSGLICMAAFEKGVAFRNVRVMRLGDVSGRRPSIGSLPGSVLVPAETVPNSTGSRHIEWEVQDIEFDQLSDLNRFQVSGRDQGHSSVRGGKLQVGSGKSDDYKLVYRGRFSEIESVTIWGGISQKKNFRFGVGPIWAILNWEVKPENHIRNGGVLTIVTPPALRLGKMHKIELKQRGESVSLSIDERIIYATQAKLNGGFWMSSALGGGIFVDRIRIVGRRER